MTIEDKAKSYCALVWCKREITEHDREVLNAVSDLEIAQKTPIRVLHRRSQLVRDKKVYRLFAEPVSAHYINLHVLASAGTYIKELVHGDLGRTQPSIGGLLGVECDILQLDVTNVFDNIEQALSPKEGDPAWYQVTLPRELNKK